MTVVGSGSGRGTAVPGQAHALPSGGMYRGAGWESGRPLPEPTAHQLDAAEPPETPAMTQAGQPLADSSQPYPAGAVEPRERLSPAGPLLLTTQLSRSAAARMHYLGAPTRTTLEYADEFGWITFSNPTSRRLPTDWLELNRWVLKGIRNGGSRQWSKAVRWLRATAPVLTTVVSYSDPSVGHTGALYKACGFLWAPTWHRLIPPPTGNGTRAGKAHGVKDRWVYLLGPDPRRAGVLGLPPSYAARFPGASYVEPKRRYPSISLRSRAAGIGPAETVSEVGSPDSSTNSLMSVDGGPASLAGGPGHFLERG